MASKSLLFLGLLFAIILIISSDVVLARNEPSGVAEINGAGVDGGHHHHCHHPHCREEGGQETENDVDHHEEAKTHETTKSSEVDGDGHDKHKCKHWPHC